MNISVYVFWYICMYMYLCMHCVLLCDMCIHVSSTENEGTPVSFVSDTGLYVWPAIWLVSE
jgi:hypothetical protein